MLFHGVGTTSHRLIGHTTPVATFLGTVPGIQRMKMPMRFIGKMQALVNDRAALNACLRDRTSAGNLASLAFLRSYIQAGCDIESEDFDICPILLTQPAADGWTPLDYRTPFLNRIRKVELRTVLLENAGHYRWRNPV